VMTVAAKTRVARSVFIVCVVLDWWSRWQHNFTVTKARQANGATIRKDRLVPVL
jgi:hypothetical protein